MKERSDGVKGLERVYAGARLAPEAIPLKLFLALQEFMCEIKILLFDM